MAIKGLPTLIRLNSFIVDEKRRALGVLLAREDEVLGQIAAHEQELRVEQDIARSNSQAGMAYGRYADRWLARRDQLNTLLEAVRREVEAAREDLAEAYRELKTYEEALAVRQEQERAEEARQEQIRLDEIAVMAHQRKERAS